MRKLILLLALPAVGAGPLSAADLPLTRAEASNYTATSSHAEVMTFIRELQQRSSRVRVESLGTSTGGLPIPLLVIGDPVPASPSDLRHDGRAVVYFQANIHAGEVEGKDAFLMVARDLATGPAAKYLDRLVVLIAPNFNPDGNEQVSTANRTNQNGPAGGVGVRVNGQNLDLNRDGIKLESPEVRGLVQNVLRRWDPVFFLDSHTHNGSYHEEPVTWVWGLNPNGDAGIFDYMAGTVWPAIEKQMRERHGTLTIPHGDFLDVKQPGKGWVPLGPEPRYLSNYVGLRNRLAVLDEQYPYVDFGTRVKGARSLMLSFLDFLHGRRDEVVALVGRADRATVARGASPGPNDVFVIGTQPAALERKLTIHGFEMEVTDTGGRYPKVRPTATKRLYKDVPYLARYAPTRTVRLPRGYLISARDPAIVDKIREHGIVVERLAAPASLRVEAFSVTKLNGSEYSDQGHYTSTVEGDYATKEVVFPPGTWFVSMAQPLANVAAQLLEPESPDGLVTWNFLDRYIAFQWMPQPMEYPVYRLHEAANLVTESLP
ncbi:MAG: M14 family metallopeptidase [Gammaproteobacteria bacterium]